MWFCDDSSPSSSPASSIYVGKRSHIAIPRIPSSKQVVINSFTNGSNECQSPRLEIQELAALVRGELCLYEQQQFMLFFCLSFRFREQEVTEEHRADD
jgi:hypothetical protein